MKKVGILTCHFYPNFGSTLQAIALQNTIKKLGHNVKIINYINPKFGVLTLKEYWIKYKIKPLICKIFGQKIKRFSNNPLRFQLKYQETTKIVQTDEELKQISSKFDIIVCGSDQIWSPAHFYIAYLAGFTDECTSKISYAASIGTNNIPEDLLPTYRNLLSDFKFISVREDMAKKILKDMCGLDSVTVLDPTLLLDVVDYEKMEEPLEMYDDNFVFCYFLNKNHKYNVKEIRNYADERHLSVVGFSANSDDDLRLKLLKNLSAGNFLWLVHHSKMVVTDSYHGTIFSLIYHKEFALYYRFLESDINGENSRIKQLDTFFGISSRIIDNAKRFDTLKNFAFDEFDKKRNILRDTSLNYLRTAIGNA